MRRMSYGRLGLVAALENEEITPEETAPVGDNAESLETDLLEVSDSSTEGDVEAEQTEEATEVAEALESIAECLKISAANGGLDRHAAAAVGTAVEHLYARVGIRGTAMPALESFGGTSSRVGATQIALEDMKGKIASIWKAIIDAIKRAYQWVVDHFNKVFGAAEKLQKRAQKVAAAADGLSGKAKETAFENASIFKALHVGGSVSALPASMQKAADFAKEGLVTHGGDTVKQGKELIEAIQDVSKINGLRLGGTGAPGKETNAYGEAGEGMVWRQVSDVLPGNVAFVTRAPAAEKTGVEALAVFGKLKAGIMPADPKAKEPTQTKVNTLAAGDIAKTAKVVEGLATDLVGFRKTNQELQAVLKEAVKAAEKASKEFEKDEDGEKKAVGAAVRAATGNLANYLIGGFKSLSEYSLRTGKAALDYCELSAKQYDGK